MKALIRRPLKALWNKTRSLRRPLIERYAQFLRQVQATPVIMGTSDSQWECVILELMRLQDQVERLQSSIDELSHGRSGLSVVDAESESGAESTRLRVG